VTYFSVLPQQFSGSTEEKYENTIQVSRYPGLDSHTEAPEYKH